MEELKIVLVIALVVAFVALIMGFMALSKAKKALEKTDKERIRKYSKDVFDQQIVFYFNQKVKKMIREEFVRQHTLLVSTSKPKETAAPKEKKAEPQPVKKEPESLVKQVSEQPKENNDTSVTFYTGSYKTGSFLHITTTPDEKTIFTIDADSAESSEGVLDIDVNAYNKIAQTPEFLEGACDCSGSGSRVVVLEKGVVVKENGVWIVKNPIVAEFK